MRLVFTLPPKGDIIGNVIKVAGILATGDASVSHVGIVIGDFVYESLLIGGVSKSAYKAAYKRIPHELWEVCPTQMPGYNENQAKEWLEKQTARLINLYGFHKIPLQAFDALASFVKGKRVYPMTKLFATPYFPICSSLTSYVLYRFGRDALPTLFKGWRGHSPDDIHDIVCDERHFRLLGKNR